MTNQIIRYENFSTLAKKEATSWHGFYADEMESEAARIYSELRDLYSDEEISLDSLATPELEPEMERDF